MQSAVLRSVHLPVCPFVMLVDQDQGLEIFETNCTNNSLFVAQTSSIYSLRPPLPQDWGSQAPPKTSIAISGTGKATNFKFCTHIHRIVDRSEQKPIKNFGKSSRGRTQALRDARKFSGHVCIGRIARSSLR